MRVGPSREANGHTVQCIVVSPVLELIADGAADFEAMLGRHGDVTKVEEIMDIRTQE